jgi:hypothetical protein
MTLPEASRERALPFEVDVADPALSEENVKPNTVEVAVEVKRRVVMVSEVSDPTNAVATDALVAESCVVEATPVTPKFVVEALVMKAVAV